MNYFDVTSTATRRSPTTSVQRERSAPWTTRGRVETNISPHGLLFFNGLWQRYISSRCVVFPTSFLQRRAEQRRVFALPCVHPRAGRQCIALTKRKACRASLLWAKRRRGGAVWSSLTSTKAGEFKTKLKINHLRSSPGPPELAGFYVDSHFGVRVWVSSGREFWAGRQRQAPGLDKGRFHIGGSR